MTESDEFAGRVALVTAAAGLGVGQAVARRLLPPVQAETFEVQRFQSALSAFTVVWNYLAIVAIIFWLLFYVR